MSETPTFAVFAHEICSQSVFVICILSAHLKEGKWVKQKHMYDVCSYSGDKNMKFIVLNNIMYLRKKNYFIN